MTTIWVRVVGGALLFLVGLVWVLQGSGATGASGGMNGQAEWTLIGMVVAVVGLVLLAGGIRRLRTANRR